MEARILTVSKDHLAILVGAITVYGVDAISKAWIINTLSLGESIRLVPQVFHLTHLQNTGAAFSLLHQHPEFLTLIAGGLFVVLLGYVLTRPLFQRQEIVGFTLVLGGALGNLVDRLRLGAVTDFLDFTLIHYPVFNLADSFIFIGVILLFANYVQHYQTSRS